MITISRNAGTVWTAARTQARCEKKVQQFCSLHDIPCYLPLCRRARRYQRRVVESYVPMFSGYIFVQLSPPQRDFLSQFQKIVSVLLIAPLQEEQLIAELQDIQVIERLAQSTDIVVRPELTPGSPVLITAGPLQGLHGIVERRTQCMRVTVNVEMLGQSVTVDLDATEVMREEESG